MKIKDITEGLGNAFAGSLSRAIGANTAAEYFDSGARNYPELKNIPEDEPTFFTDPAKVSRFLDVLTVIGKKSNNELSMPQLGSIIAKKIPSAWRAEQNKRTVLSNIAKQLAERGIQVVANQKKPADAATTTWKMGDPIAMPDGSVITASDGNLYKQVAAQYQK